MAKAADIGSKRLIGLAPEQWARWVTQMNVDRCELLSSDFQWVSREGDILIKAHSPQLGEFLIVNELQLRYTPKLPRRMRAYAGLAEEKFQLPTYPVLINILPPNAHTEIEKRYESNCGGLQARQDYRIINLWEVSSDIVFQQPLPPLLPFVPVLAGGSDERIVRLALQKLREEDDLRDLETLLAFFASFVMNTQLVSEIMRWDMAVLRESPWYQEIEQKGIQIGLEQGIEQGIERVARNLLQMGISLDQVRQATGLTVEQVQQLQE